MTERTPQIDDLLTDDFDRRVNYLRVSITRRCNFRCIYCMPDGGIEFEDRRELLSFDEIEEVVSVFVDHGVRKVRLTGGEPLVRGDVPALVERLADLDGLERVALTTNAFLLERHADDLRAAGLDGINISLDTLQADKFEEIAQVDGLERVLGGIRSAKEVGFDPVKINTVVIRGFNDDEIDDLVRFGAEHGAIPRFIEFMPMGHDTHWEHADDSGFVSAQAIRDDLRTRWDVEPEGESYGAGPAKYWRLRGEGLPDEGHPVGVIGAVTECFCADCNRMRLTATGGLRACLADDREISVRAPLRTLADEGERRAAIRSRIRQSLGGKKERHDFALEGDGVTEKPMTAIGG